MKTIARLGELTFNAVQGSEKITLPRVKVRSIKTSGLVGSMYAWDTFACEPFKLSLIKVTYSAVAGTYRDACLSYIGTVQKLELKTVWTIGDAMETYLVKVIDCEFDAKYGIVGAQNESDTIFTAILTLEAVRDSTSNGNSGESIPYPTGDYPTRPINPDEGVQV